MSETRKALARPKESPWRSLTVAVLLAAVMMGNVTRGADAAGGDPAGAVIARARAALGPGLGHVRSLHLAGTVSAGDVSGTTDAWIDLVDGRFAAITDAGPLTAGIGYDGKNAWSSDAKGIVLPQNGPMAKAILATAIYDNSYALYRPGYGGAALTYLGARLDAGKTYEAITVTPQGGYAQEWWFDPATGLPARMIIDYGAGPATTSFDDYRSAGGLMIAERQIVSRQWALKDFYGNKRLGVTYTLTYAYAKAEVDSHDLEQHLVLPHPPVTDVSLPGGETRIPFTMRNFWITIDVRLNGKGPFEMMLDSGGRNILSPSAAWQTGARDTGEIPLSGNAAMLKPTRYARVATMELGGATLKQQDFTVGGVGNIFTRDGMIGYEVFERFVTTIDYVNRQIILRLPGADHAYAPSQAAGVAELPLMFDQTKPLTSCTIAGTDATCMVDTGGSLPLLLSGPFAKANAEIQPPWYAGAYRQVNAGGSGSEVRVGPVSSMQLGPFVMMDINTMFTTMANGVLALYPSALVGNPIWSRFDVTFDYARGRLWLKPNSNFKN